VIIKIKRRKNKMDKKEFDLEMKLIELRHKFNLEEIKTEKESRLIVEQRKHDLELERQRIRNADIQRTILNKKHSC
jgi:hypothetical protein